MHGEKKMGNGKIEGKPRAKANESIEAIHHSGEMKNKLCAQNS